MQSSPSSVGTEWGSQAERDRTLGGREVIFERCFNHDVCILFNIHKGILYKCAILKIKTSELSSEACFCNEARGFLVGELCAGGSRGRYRPLRPSCCHLRS